MNNREFAALRKRLRKTQKELAELLGTSIKAIHSYEQGWRSVPAHAERQLYFLITRLEEPRGKAGPCWQTRQCPAGRRKKCPAWEFKAGHLCWFVNGTFCEGTARKSWQEKMEVCRTCDVLRSLLQAEEEESGSPTP